MRMVWLGGGVAVLSILILKFLPVPFAWLALLWAAAAAAGIVLARSRYVKLACVSGMSVLVSLAVAETVLAFLAATPPERRVTPFYYVPDPVLGWRLRPGLVSRDVERIDGKLFYDVTYTIDAAGRRVSPPDRGVGAEGCVLFFGCSATFGQGVPDDATLPYRAGVLSGGRFKIANFATSGYGAEHMLALLERGEVRVRTPCRPTHVIYQAIPNHVARAAHLVDFSAFGPRYVLGPDGNPTYAGTNQGNQTPVGLQRITAEIAWQMSKSRLYRTIRNRRHVASPADLPLYLAIVRRSRDLLLAEYPGVAFHILLWGHRQYFAGDLKLLEDGLAAVTPNLHLVDNVLRDYQAAPLKYQLHPLDPHPNPLAHDLIARYVVADILPRP